MQVKVIRKENAEKSYIQIKIFFEETFSTHILIKALKLYIDYNPRKERDKPSYQDKRSAMEMIETIQEAYLKDEKEMEKQLWNEEKQAQERS